MKLLTDIRLWIAIGLTCLTLFLWLATGLITTGDPPSPLGMGYRLGLLAVLLLALISLIFAIQLSSARTNATVLEDISASDPDSSTGSDPSMLSEEEAQLRAKFMKAADMLKKKRFGRFGSKQHLYQLPWYIVLGSPGSGKTTAIRHSGLEFPLDELTEGNSLGGVGGTRNCDWWITDQAVLLDTAGRYTTQDSDAKYDAKGWLNFLDLLRKNRKQQPINGAVLVVSTEELLRLTENEWKLHKRTITTRLRELAEQLQMDFPVYLLVTKVDLLPGCREFFDSLDVDEQDQIWGTTLPPGASTDDLASELKALARRLHQQLPQKLRYERDTKRRQAIYSFPWQMETVIDRLEGMVNEVFSRQGVKEHTRFRGLYFTSAVQEGTPIERLFAAVTSGFGISSSVSTRQENSRSLFISKLFPDVIFPEAFLASTNAAHDRRMRSLRLAAFTAIILLGVGLAFVWTGAFTVHRNLIVQAKADLGAFEESNHGLEQPMMDNLQALSHLQAAASVFDQQQHPWLANLGMYDSAVDNAAGASYIRTIETVLAPSLGQEMSRWLSTYNAGDYQTTLNGLKAYLMLGDYERRENDWFLDWLAYPPIRALQLDTEGQSVEHMAALFDEQPAYELLEQDEIIIKRTRNILQRATDGEAVYSRVKSMYAGELTDLLPRMGPYFTSVFETEQPDGPMVPSLFTVRGYQTVDFGVDSEAVRGWLQDRWVIGEEGMVNPAELTLIADEVRQLYAKDYILTWRGFLAEIELMLPRDMGRLSDTLGYLSQSELSPMSSVLRTLVEETTLPEDSQAMAEAGDIAAEMALRRMGRAGDAARRIGAAGLLPDKLDIPTEVNNAFSPYHNMARGGAGSKDARVTKEMGDTRQWLEFAQHTANSVDPSNPARKMALTSRDLAQPFSSWVAALAQEAQSGANSQKLGQLNARWQSEVARECNRSFDGRYPFSLNADADTRLADFEDFFAPDGIEESFVEEYLQPIIRKQDGTLSKGTIWSIRQSDRIREAFFPNGRDLGFNYQLTGVDVDDRIGQLIIESGNNQRVRFKHGPPVPLELRWPDGDDGIKLTFMRKDGSIKRRIIGGPWAIFRAVFGGQTSSMEQVSGANSLLVTFDDGDHYATFRITSGSRINPFLPGLLDKYRCRNSL